MQQALAVLNAGSSSLKFAVYRLARGAAPERVLRGAIEGVSGADAHARALAAFELRLASEAPTLHLVAAGHRVVHGGARFTAPALVTDAVLAELRALVPLAPRHQPHAIAAIETLRAARPELAQVACFDTAFHHTLPEVARRFALPQALYDAGIRRYGFHGLSLESIVAQLPQQLDERADGRVIVLHLGSGASATALRGRTSVATSMGLTPLDGLVMGTRAGALDPGVLLHLLRDGWDEARLARLLYDESGLLGVSGISRDLRALLASEAPAAKLALDLFVESIVREVGGQAVLLGGLDALVFTGGIGENAAEVRARVCERLAWLGMALDAEANARGGLRITREGSAVSCWVLATDEEGVIARATAELLR
ncbi:MAG: acetate/propionate family kinase [Deltaproteobacteria bacterium]|nr:acetate/propionate family kinase [Deltaproteobacteria bacterium]